MQTLTAPALAEKGDVIFRDEDSIRSEISKLSLGVSFVNGIPQEFNDLKLNGTILEFINACMSRDGYYKYIEQAGKISDEECRKHGMILPALVEVVRNKAVEQVTNFVNRVVSLAERDNNITSVIHLLQMVEGEIQIKQRAIDQIENQYTISLDNDERVEFWNLVLTAKENLEEIKKAIYRHRPNNSVYDIDNVISINLDLGSGKGQVVSTRPQFVKLISSNY